MALLLAGWTASAPVCGAEGREGARRELVTELNRARQAAGRPPLEPHPALCRVAAWRARETRESGDPSAGFAVLNELTRRLYEDGYHSHAWIESALIGDPLAGKFAQWRSVRPEWYRDAVEGDYEHVGVGIETRFGQPVFALVLALSRCTMERRRAEPLRDLEAVRLAALAASNGHRATAGRAALVADAVLDGVAQGHAQAMAERGFYAHRSPEGETPRQRAAAAGYPRPGSVGENIAKGIFTPSEVVDRWMDSSGHRDNLLRRAARRAGLGVAIGETGRPGECVEAVWVQLIAEE